jgi:hypothetical protein
LAAAGRRAGEKFRMRRRELAPRMLTDTIVPPLFSEP